MKIQIHELQASVRLGCTHEERAFPQIVRFEIVLDLLNRESLESDRLEDTVDYMEVLRVVQNVCAEGEFKLLEKLVGTIGREVLELSKMINSVKISATKQITPLAHGISFTAKLRRER